MQTTGSDTANGGNFDPGCANMSTNLAATFANTASPVVTSATYTFVSGDVGAWLFNKPTGVWQGGWYPIVSVAGGAATLGAAVGFALASLPFQLAGSIVAGGSGYAVGDTITLTGGTIVTNAVLTVAAVSSGAVTRVTVNARGFLTATPSNPVSQGATSGSGTGATFSINWMTASQSRSTSYGEQAAVGCASTASPTGGTWTIDYSQSAVTAANTLTGLTSAGAGLVVLCTTATVAMIGNGIAITGGTLFNVGIYNVSNVSVGVNLALVGPGNAASGVGCLRLRGGESRVVGR